LFGSFNITHLSGLSLIFLSIILNLKTWYKKVCYQQ